MKENLILDGQIDVSGTPGVNPGSSGGSGGSILLKSNSFKGKGNLIADGGDSGNVGNPGSGGGGRIASYSQSYEFTGKSVLAIIFFNTCTLLVIISDSKFNCNIENQC